MAPFVAGEVCLLLDDEGRKFLLDLTVGKDFSTHQGRIPHDRLIGSAEGTRFTTDRGAGYVALRPRREDFVLKMKRGPQVVYPKDVGPILVHGDIRPGHTVLEAGTGSGALTLALVDAVGERGRVVSVERRDDHLAFAMGTVNRWFGAIPPNLDLRIGDVAEVVADLAPDRVVLDLPEPWHTIEAGVGTLPGGAVVVAYIPSVPQMEQTHRSLVDGGYVDVTALEVWFREWNIDGRSVRPSHRMVGHTGFLVIGRAGAPHSDQPPGPDED